MLSLPNGKRIVVGMSGGVDSSVVALLLKEAGNDVIGLFMHNWHETSEDGACTAEEDFADVRRIASVLNIPYYTIDLSSEYQTRVFNLFVEEYKAGRTPNPDVLCNREIKFGPFKEYATRLDADYIATGHYAGLKTDMDGLHLVRAKDENKDQTYFLNQLSVAQLENVLFPLAQLTKSQVREIARIHGLATAEKKDSTGICFIGERNFRKFLSNYIPMQRGETRDLSGKLLGHHNGVFYYTIGQRKGLSIGGGEGEAYFVVKKDVENNILYVNQGECPELFSSQLIAKDFNYINSTISDGSRILVRTRHRQPLVPATAYTTATRNTLRFVFDTPVRAVTPGQFAVAYSQDICLGGGVIS
ncbi:MAG: tRNA 2-thiouridine(34) synthase MnmA [Christensenellaceae bacterium]|jgi:tRNA-specific 2-thiouridylase|nr:tRNA 2-thiouridine(34) synthase MnmA [Christensenellaceae bacterium]